MADWREEATRLLVQAARYGSMPPVPVERLACNALYLNIKEEDEPARHHPDPRVQKSGRLRGLLLPGTREIILSRRHVRTPAERRRTIAHEIGHFKRHYSLGQPGFYTCAVADFVEQEREADDFAAELLIPEAALADHLADLHGNVIRLAARYEVPGPMMTSRLVALGLWCQPWHAP